jgi:hypothetical protein
MNVRSTLSNFLCMDVASITLTVTDVEWFMSKRQVGTIVIHFPVTPWLARVKKDIDIETFLRFWHFRYSDK